MVWYESRLTLGVAIFRLVNYDDGVVGGITVRHRVHREFIGIQKIAAVTEDLLHFISYQMFKICKFLNCLV